MFIFSTMTTDKDNEGLDLCCDIEVKGRGKICLKPVLPLINDILFLRFFYGKCSYVAQ